MREAKMGKRRGDRKQKPQASKAPAKKHQDSQAKGLAGPDMLLQQIQELQANMSFVRRQRSEHLQLRDALLFLLSRLDSTFPGIQRELSEYFSTNHNLSGHVDITTYNVEGYENLKDIKETKAAITYNPGESMKFSDFKLKHQGETCYIFGAGPSSIKFAHEEKTPHFSIGINEAVKTVGCTYGITTDKDAFVKHDDEDVIWFLPEYMNERPGVPSREPTANGKNIVLWKMTTWRDTTKLDQSVEELAASAELFCYSSSAHPAVHLAHYMGAKQLVLVGIDGSLSIDWYAIHKGVTHTLCEMFFPDAHSVYVPPAACENRMIQPEHPVAGLPEEED